MKKFLLAAAATMILATPALADRDGRGGRGDHRGDRQYSRDNRGDRGDHRRWDRNDNRDHRRGGWDRGYRSSPRAYFNYGSPYAYSNPYAYDYYPYDDYAYGSFGLGYPGSLSFGFNFR